MLEREKQMWLKETQALKGQFKQVRYIIFVMYYDDENR